MRTMELARAAHKAVHHCARLTPGENVLVLADSIVDRGLVDAFASAAYALGGETQVMTFETRPEINREPPKAVAAALAAADLVLDLIQQYIIHTSAYWRAREGGTRILCGTGITEEMLIRLVGGVGSTFDLTDGRGGVLRLEIVGLLGDSIFQGDVLMSERACLQHFPEVNGYR